MTLVRPVAGSARSEKKSPDRLARLLALGRPIVMGVLNVTPDSFSDGGRFLDPVDAIDQARRMTAEGADLLDIGAESTRPYGGAVAAPLAEEMRRLCPVLPAVVGLGVSGSRFSSALRASASSTPYPPPRRTNAWADRSPPICSRSQAERRSSAPTTSPRPCRRCASPRPSGAPDDRCRLRHRACAACLSRRDAARGPGRANLQPRPRARHRPRRGFALRPARAYGGLRPGRRGGEPGGMRPSLSAALH